MAAATLSRLLRRTRTPAPLYFFSSHPCHHHHHHSIFDTSLHNVHALHPQTPCNLFSSSRAFSTRGDSEEFSNIRCNADHTFTNSELLDISVVSDVTGHADVPMLPARALISFLDLCHDVTGLPWWFVIVSCTLAFRLTLFPLVVLQMKKLQTIGQFFPKLPPPLPPPFSGRSFRDQFVLFQKERRAAGCPTYLWFAASYAQIPFFFLGIYSIRRMSLDHHPGFDCGGTLWFQNLTEYPNGDLGPIFPILIACLHLVNVKVSFHNSSIDKMGGTIGAIAKYYKAYLHVLTLIFLVVTFNIPQGSLIYWLTNSSLTLVQQLALKHPDILMMLGLPDKGGSVIAGNDPKFLKLADVRPSKKKGKIDARDLSPKELVNLSIKLLTEGQKDRAVFFLRLALDKDPENIRALLVMGQTLLQDQLFAEATQHLERAISKLLRSGQPTEVEDVDLLILSSVWAGSACMRLNKIKEGIAHLERVGHMAEPEDPKSKAHYYDGVMMLGSALSSVDRNVEAIKYIRKAAAYDPKYYALLENFESKDDFVSDLVGSRRGDY